MLCEGLLSPETEVPSISNRPGVRAVLMLWTVISHAALFHNSPAGHRQERQPRGDRLHRHALAMPVAGDAVAQRHTYFM